MQLRSLAAALVALATVGRASAWTISTTNATQPEEVLGPHQAFVKTWTVRGDAPLRALDFAGAGPVFVDHDASLNPVATAPTPTPSSASGGSGSGSGLLLPTPPLQLAYVSDVVVAQITLSGNCSKLLDELEVVERHGSLRLHFRNRDFQGYGYILTQVRVANAAVVAQLAVTGSSSVYVGEKVLVSSNASAELELKISGSGDLFVEDAKTAYTARVVRTTISGQGTLQFHPLSIASDVLEAKVSGDGAIAVVADVVVAESSLDAKVSGQGVVFVQAANVSAFRLSSSISGDGEITVATNGSCVQQTVSISGEGTVATGSVVCEDTTVKRVAEGKVLVQTTRQLLVPHELDGQVQYVGAAPQSITDGRKPHRNHKKHTRHTRNWRWWWDEHDDCGGNCEEPEDPEDAEVPEDPENPEDDDRYLPASVTQAENQYATYTLAPVPPREPVFLVLDVRASRWGNEPNERITITISDIGSAFAAHTQALAARVPHVHRVAHGFFVVGFAAVALSAVVISVHQVVRRRRRGEYSPLLPVAGN